MPRLRRRLLLCAALLGAASAPSLAQQRPPAQPEELLRGRPELVQQLRQRIATSGLTPEQVRARLRAEGYPETLLNAYLPGGGPVVDSLPNADVLAAVRSLGISDSTDLELMTGAADCDPADSLAPADSVGAAGRSAWSRARAERCPDRGTPARGERQATSAAARRAELFPDSGYALFGADLFARATTQFDPNLAGPVDATYRLGPGDRLVLILTGDVEAAHQLDVTREGFVVIPQVGTLDVANLTLGQLEDLLYTRLGRVYSGVRRGPNAATRFSVSVARLRSNQIYAMGNVARPGSYRVSSAGTAMTALYAAGGPNADGSMRRVEVRRGGGVVSTLDLYDYLLRGDASRDVRLETGDVLFVPVHGARARVVGEVVRPSTYEIMPGETLADLLRFAGGFRPTAERRRVQIERIVPPEHRGRDRRAHTVIDITSDGLGNGHEPAVGIEPGDVVRVFAVAPRVRNRVVVQGSVWSPGALGHTPGMTIADALRLAGGVTPDVFLGQLLITRRQPDSTLVQLRAALRDTTGAVLGDFPLQEDDEIRVFSLSEFRPARFVAISGAVRKSGRYPHREGMTLRDLVLLAGGLRESAYLAAAEVARLPEDRTNGVTARTLRVPLDSSYLFARGPNGDYAAPRGLPAPGGPGPEVELHPYDNVLVLHQPDWELQRSVTIAGEVRFPGKYALAHKTERLSDLIRRAGGLTGEAHPDGVVFYRSRGRLGRIGIDLPEVLRTARHQDNMLLQDGDSIFVPVYNAVVNVTGAVNSPVAVAYAPGRDVMFYLRAAGGPSRRADAGRAYVTQPNGKVESIARRPLLPDGVPKPRAGSTVHVPERDPSDRRDYAALAIAATQIMATLVAVAAAIINLRRN